MSEQHYDLESQLADVTRQLEAARAQNHRYHNDIQTLCAARNDLEAEVARLVAELQKIRQPPPPTQGDATMTITIESGWAIIKVAGLTIRVTAEADSMGDDRAEISCGGSRVWVESHDDGPLVSRIEKVSS